MKTPWLMAALGLGAAAGVMLAMAPAVTAAVLGETAPCSRVAEPRGTTRASAEFRGSTVVLEWTDPGCRVVRRHCAFGSLASHQRAAAGEGLVRLTVEPSAPGSGRFAASVSTRVQPRGHGDRAAALPAPDAVARRAHGATTPHHFLTGLRGVLRCAGGRTGGANAGPACSGRSTQRVLRALAVVMDGRPVSISISTPYGCPVRYANCPAAGTAPR